MISIEGAPKKSQTTTEFTEQKTESHFTTLIVYLRLEGMSKTVQFLPCFHRQHCQPLNHVAQDPPSSLALSTSQDEAPTAPLGNLFQCLTILSVRNFTVTSNVIVPFQLETVPFILSLSPQAPFSLFPDCSSDTYEMQPCKEQYPEDNYGKESVDLEGKQKNKLKKISVPSVYLYTQLLL